MLHPYPSSISVQIKKLEQELGVRLFNRGRKRLTLTESGKLFLDNVVPAMENLRRAKTMVKDTAGPLTRQHSCRLSLRYQTILFADAGAAFAKIYKDVNLTILTRDNAETMSLLSSGQADFGMARTNPPSSQFFTHPLLTTHPRLILPREHFLSAKKTISLADLRDCRFVFLPKEHHVTTPDRGSLLWVRLYIERFVRSLELRRYYRVRPAGARTGYRSRYLRSTERAGLEGCRYHHNFRYYRSKSHWQRK
jgi:DNA-binding transcriptional LysR family regulator